MLLCDVYRSARHDGMYLYVARGHGLGRVPAPLRERFGRAELALSLRLTPERRLARAEAGDVLAAIERRGFYLQLPPRPPSMPGARR